MLIESLIYCHGIEYEIDSLRDKMCTNVSWHVLARKLLHQLKLANYECTLAAVNS